jgi:hypothetical protein
MHFQYVTWSSDLSMLCMLLVPQPVCCFMCYVCSGPTCYNVVLPMALRDVMSLPAVHQFNYG